MYVCLFRKMQYTQLCTYLRSSARHAMHLQFDINVNAIEIRAVQSPKFIVVMTYPVRQLIVYFKFYVYLIRFNY
jgi:hypothetical protein